MATQAKFNGVVYLTSSQYNTLKDSGTITSGGITLTYSPDDTIYITTDENVVSIDSVLDAESTNPVQNKAITTWINVADQNFSAIDTAISNEKTARTEADTTLQENIDKKVINDAKITVTQGGVTKGSFTLNQSTNSVIALDSDGVSAKYLHKIYFYSLEGTCFYFTCMNSSSEPITTATLLNVIQDLSVELDWYSSTNQPICLINGYYRYQDDNAFPVLGITGYIASDSGVISDLTISYSSDTHSIATATFNLNDEQISQNVLVIKDIVQRILKFLKIEHLAENPYSERLTYINSMPELLRYEMQENEIWFKGDSNELLNFYTNQETYGFMLDPMYNRNRKNYFHAIASTESSIKRVHSGLPRAIVETIVNAIGVPQITINGKGSDLISRTHLNNIINQQQLPYTLAVGWGAFKVSFDERLYKVCKHPIIKFYQAKDVEIVQKEGIDIGVIFKDYYSYKGKDYLLLETRRINDAGNSCVEYDLFKLKGKNEVEPVPLSAIPELGGLQDIELKGYSKLLAVPSRFFFNEYAPAYGRSIYAGKIDLFDDLDQSLSQRSQTCRVSTPVEYYPSDLLEFDRNGKAKLPDRYDRQYMQKPGGVNNGDGDINGTIQTTQPELNFDQYTSEQMALVSQILIGILSPATMGIDVARKDNANAQREKEKITTMTRNNIVESERKIISKLVELIIDLDEYANTGSITPNKELSISVKYPNFASPSFESKSQILVPMWTNGAISTELFVERLYGDDLSIEDKAKQVKWLNEQRLLDQQLTYSGTNAFNEREAMQAVFTKEGVE